MDQSPQTPHSGRMTAGTRLRNMSHATVRRLSRPLSIVSNRSASSALEPTPTPMKLKKTSTRNSIASRTSQAERPASSRRTSLLSTGGSSVSRDDREPLGELPVFGVSQRAYLASLVSLFSNGNGHSNNNTPLSANTPITDPSSGAPSLGPYEYDIHSSAIYQYTKVRRLYVGWPGIVNPPPEALLEFEMETLPLLERDLQGISGHLGQQGIRITYELRMSGYASATAETVSLSPTVWILYRAYSDVGSKVSVAELHQAVADIFYLQKGLEIQEGGGRVELTSDRGIIDVKSSEKENIQLSDGGKLSIHIEDCQDKYTVCGALCCVTVEEDSNQVQSLCRIGGLLKINGKYILGVSTAHAMLEGSGIFRDSFDETIESRLPPGHAVDRDEILSQSDRVSTWHNITRDAAVDFLGISMNSRGEMAINRSKPENATDFALLRLSKMPGYVRNKYIPPRAEEPVSITSTASASAAALDEGPVYIICGGGDVADGQLVWGSACFIVRGRNFRVRRIQTSRPLSAGITGAWVVRGEVLYGCILAVYENEPFALMMTVERLFASILGSAFSIRSVELWDGEVPEALIRKIEEKGESSKASKSIHSAKTRRRAKNETREDGEEAGPSKDIEIIKGAGALSRPRNKSEGTQTQILHPLPSTAEGGTQTEEPCPPNTNAVPEAGGPSASSVEEPPSPGTTQPGVQTGSEGMATDAPIGAVIQGDSVRPSASKDKQRSNTGGSAVSASAQTTYTTASETLQRQDSGFESAAAPVTIPTDGPDEANEETPRRGLQAPPIRPTDNNNNNDANTRGVVWSHEGQAGNLDEDTNGRVHGEVNGDVDKTPTKTHSRRSSFHKVFGRPFRGSHSRKSSQIDNDENHGIPQTGLDGKRPLFNRRRSSAIESKPATRDGKPNGASSLLDEWPLSVVRRGTAQSQDPRQVDKAKNPGTRRGTVDGDQRRLSFIRRISMTKAPEPDGPVRNSDPVTTRSSGTGERPLSFIRRSKGKAPEESGRSSNDRNHGIPSRGL